jgi:hypothetical protein
MEFVSTKPRKRPSRVTDLDIGKALHHHRTSRRMTQIQFGALIGVSYQQLGISVDDLLGLNGLDGSQRQSRTGQNTPRLNRTDPDPG